MATYKITKNLKTILLVSLFLFAGVLFLSPKHAAAIGDNFPQGHSVYNEWVLLSQYQCPGHCLDTPKADIRIFYRVATMNSQGITNGTSLEVDVQVDCRYNGTPDGSASLDGGTTRAGWPYVTCTGLNSSSGASETQAFRVTRGNLNCSESGSSGKYFGYCFTDLHLRVNSNPGNQPIVGAWISSGDGLGGVRITALEEDNPGQNYTNTDCYTGAGGTCSPSGGPPTSDHLFTLWNNYANNGPDTHHNWDLTFAPDCTVKSNKTVYLRWYDADDGGSGNNGTQSGQISFDLHDDTANAYIYNNRSSLGGNDSYRDLGFTVKPNHTYTWRWNNVSATNGIQLWVPYSEIGSVITCPPPPGNPPPNQNPVPGTVSCSASVNNNNPFLGQTVTITVTVTNESTATDWWIGTNNTNFGYSNNPSSANYPPSPPDITQPPYVANNYLHYYPHTNAALPDVVNDGSWHTKEHSVVFLETGAANALNAPQNTSRLGKGQTSFAHTYTATNTNPSVTTSTYHFGVRNDETGAYFPTSNGNSVCDVSVNWSAVSLSQYGCNDTSVYDPGGVQYYFIFTDHNSGAVIHNTGFDPGGVFNASRDFNTFVEFPYLYPHGFYDIHIVQWVSNAELDSPVSVSGCMTAQCEFSFNADMEPGQTGNVSYGVILTNSTNRTYNSNEYAVSANATPATGLSGGSVVTPIQFIANTTQPYNATFLMQANYTGTVEAHVYFGGGNIDAAIPFSNCYPSYTPQSRPTLRVTQGDIATGGGFSVKGASCSAAATFTTGAKRSVSPFTTGNANAGGLRTFAYPSSKLGSGADFAAYALGYIQGDPPGSNGFYTAGITTSGLGYNGLMFANNGVAGAGVLGGSLGGNFADGHCATDYFNTTKKQDFTTMTDPGAAFSMDNILASGQYYHAGNVVINGGTVANSRSITLYIEGDVTITNNINYGAWSFDTANYTNNAPYLMIVAKGNIYVQNNVGLMNGLYVAQPLDDGSRGSFVTCSNGSNYPDAASFIGNNCQTQLKVQGSVVAQHVYPLRASGTLSNNTGTSETFDYLPSMAVGVPNIAPNSGGASVKNDLDSISNLPPVF
jgi:hypothetical protein